MLESTQGIFHKIPYFTKLNVFLLISSSERDVTSYMLNHALFQIDMVSIGQCCLRFGLILSEIFYLLKSKPGFG